MRHNKLTKALSCLLALVLVLGLCITPAPVRAEANVDSCIADLIAYYKNYQESAETDIMRTLDEMAEIDPVQAEAWTKIMAYWSHVNTDMVVNIGTVPENLPEDNSVAVIILGFALNDDGTMKDELIGRLQTGLNIANAYPESYVVVTGGGTAKNNPDVTEGGLMGAWLLEQGLSEDRLIIENKAPNTVGNAENTYKILAEEYPQVRSLVMVTSDYHVPRGCILFYSKCLLAAYEAGGEPLEMVSNAGFYTGSNGYESISLQASGVASVAGVKASSSVTLSQLTQLYVVRESDGLAVTAIYHNGYERDITEKAEITVDEAGNATVTYTENDVTLTAVLAADQDEVTHFSTAALEALIAQAEAISPAAYTRESYEAMVTVLDEAKAVLEKEDLTYHDVELAYAALSEAIAALKTLVNIAYKMPVTVNCNESNAYKVNDGTISTGNYWASQNGSTNVPANEAELIIDLDGLYNVEAIRVYPYWGGQRIYKYELFGSADGESWEQIGENVSDDYATDQGFTHEIDATVAYVKLVGISTKVEGRADINNIHIIELQVFGTEANNIALYKPIYSSGSDQSVSSSSGAVETRVNDGDRTTYWDAGLYANQPWAVIDLQGEYLLDEINVITYWMRTDNRYYHYDLYASVDGENFTKIGAKDWDTPETALGETFDLRGQNIRATHLKIVGLYDSGNTSFHVNEIRAYGTEVEPNMVTADEPASLTIGADADWVGTFVPAQTGYYCMDYADPLSLKVAATSGDDVPYANYGTDFTFFARAGEEYQFTVHNWSETDLNAELTLRTVPEMQFGVPAEYQCTERTYAQFAFTAPKDARYIIVGSDWATLSDSALGYVPCDHLSSEMGNSTVFELKAGETYLIRVDRYTLDEQLCSITISEPVEPEEVWLWANDYLPVGRISSAYVSLNPANSYTVCSWSVSDDSIAMITDSDATSCVFRGLSEGTFDVICTTENGFIQSHTIQVCEPVGGELLVNQPQDLRLIGNHESLYTFTPALTGEYTVALDLPETDPSVSVNIVIQSEDNSEWYAASFELGSGEPACFQLNAGVTYRVNVSCWFDELHEGTICIEGDAPVQKIAAGWSGYTTWVLTDDGTLTFSPTENSEGGQTNLRNYWKQNGVLTLPWGEYADQITKVVVEDGIHDLGQMAFYELPNLTEVQLGADVIEVRNYTFKNCTALTTINLEGVTNICEGAFYGCAALTDVTLNEAVTIGDWAFSHSGFKP